VLSQLVQDVAFLSHVVHGLEQSYFYKWNINIFTNHYMRLEMIHMYLEDNLSNNNRHRKVGLFPSKSSTSLHFLNKFRRDPSNLQSEINPIKYAFCTDTNKGNFICSKWTGKKASIIVKERYCAFTACTRCSICITSCAWT